MTGEFRAEFRLEGESLSLGAGKLRLQKGTRAWDEDIHFEHAFVVEDVKTGVALYVLDFVVRLAKLPNGLAHLQSGVVMNNAWEQEKLEARKTLVNRPRIPHVRCTLCSADILFDVIQ